MAISRRDVLKRASVVSLSAAACCAFPSIVNRANASTSTDAKRARETLPIFRGSKPVYQKILMLGDSNSAGVDLEGAFYSGVMGQVSRSIMNAPDRGFLSKKVDAYATLMNPHLEITSETGVSAYLPEGFTKGGASGNLGIITPNSWVSVSNKNFDAVNFIFNTSVGLGSKWQVMVDDSLVASGVADASGSTGDIQISSSRWGRSATAKFVCTEGKILFQAVELLPRSGSVAPSVWCAAEGSQGFLDFITPERISSIAPHVNARSGNALVFAALGTNNQIGLAWRQRYIDQYLGDLVDFVSKWGDAIPGTEKFVFVIPPKPRVELPFARYDEYVDVTLRFASDNKNVFIVRTDESILGTDDTASLYNSDGVHLNKKGHALWAKVICDSLGIDLDAHLPKKIV